MYERDLRWWENYREYQRYYNAHKNFKTKEEKELVENFKNVSIKLRPQSTAHLFKNGDDNLSRKKMKWRQNDYETFGSCSIHSSDDQWAGEGISAVPEN